MKPDCFACHEREFRFLKLKHYVIKICKYCGLGETLDFRQPDYSAYHRDDCYQNESELTNNYAEKFYQLSQFPASDKSVLEIGCSTGSLLSQFAQNGWTVTGLEPSKAAASFAKKRGLNVFNSDIEHFGTKNKFDLVIMIHVLEHVDDPKETLKRLSKLTRPKGHLFLSVPNLDSLSAKLLGSRWSALLPNEHRWHFTQKSLTLLLNNSGFESIDSKTNAGAFGLAHPGKQILWSLLHLKKIFFRLCLFLPYDFLTTKMNIASNLMITARAK